MHTPWADYLLRNINDYHTAETRFEQAKALLKSTLESWQNHQPNPTAALDWLKSQPLALFGLLIPPEVLGQLNHQEDAVSENDDLPF